MVRIIYVLLTLAFVYSGPVVAQDELDDVSKSLFKIQLDMAKLGAAQDQFYLGDMYEKGTGTPRDLSQARFWYKKSAAQNFREAQRKLDNWDKARAAEARAKKLAEKRLLQQKQEDAERIATIERAKQRQATLQKNQAAAQKQQATAIKQKSKTKAKAKAKAKVDSKTNTVVKAAPAYKPAERALSVSNPPNKAVAKPGAEQAAKTKKDKDKDAPKFASNPCEGPTAKFLSTCK